MPLGLQNLPNSASDGSEPSRSRTRSQPLPDPSAAPATQRSSLANIALRWWMIPAAAAVIAAAGAVPFALVDTHTPVITEVARKEPPPDSIEGRLKTQLRQALDDYLAFLAPALKNANIEVSEFQERPWNMYTDARAGSLSPGIGREVTKVRGSATMTVSLRVDTGFIVAERALRTGLPLIRTVDVETGGNADDETCQRIAGIVLAAFLRPGSLDDAQKFDRFIGDAALRDTVKGGVTAACKSKGGFTPNASIGARVWAERSTDTWHVHVHNNPGASFSRLELR
jgi:hypothetical protein